MKVIAIFFIIYCFLKTLFYAIYEINSKKNNSGGITIILIALIGFILPFTILIFFYLNLF